MGDISDIPCILGLYSEQRAFNTLLANAQMCHILSILRTFPSTFPFNTNRIWEAHVIIERQYSVHSQAQDQRMSSSFMARSLLLSGVREKVASLDAPFD